jgi:hypothetical protein
VQVCGFAAGGHGSDGMKKSVLVPSDSGMPPAAGGETLGEASDLFGAAASPEVAIRALEEGLVLNAFARVHTEHNMSGVVRDGRGVGASMRARCFAGGWAGWTGPQQSVAPQLAGSQESAVPEQSAGPQ